MGQAGTFTPGQPEDRFLPIPPEESSPRYPYLLNLAG
jgi:hypothetical protein